MSSLHPAIAHVYTYDAAEDKLTSELMRIPSGCPGYRRSTSPASAATNPTALRTLGKDTQGLIEVVPIGRGEIVYFVERGRARKSADLESGGSGSESESEKENASVGRSRAVRQAMRKVREVERMARRMEEEMLALQEAEKQSRAGDAAAEALSDDESDDEHEDDDDEDDDEDDESDDDDESEDEDEDEDVSVVVGERVVVEERVVVKDRVVVEERVAVTVEDENESSDDDEAEDASMMSVVEEEASASAVIDEDDEDEDEWEVCEVAVQNRAAALTNDGDAWEDSLFGSFHEDADDKDTTDQQQQPEAEERSKLDKQQVAEQWTAPEDWECPIQPLPSTDFNVFNFGFGATSPVPTKAISAGKKDEDELEHTDIHKAPRKTKNWTLPEDEPGTPTRADRMADLTRADGMADAGTRIGTDAVEDLRADSRMEAETRTKADPRTRTEADVRTRTDQRIEPRTQADVRTRADPRTRMEADQRTRTNVVPKEPTRMIVAEPQDLRTISRISADPKARVDADRTRTNPRTFEPTRMGTMVPTGTRIRTNRGARTKRNQLPRMDAKCTARPMVSDIRITQNVVKASAALGGAGIVDVRTNSSSTRITARPTTSTAAATPTTTQDPSRGKKRKAEDDNDTPQDPQVSQALARTQSLAGLRFKKMKTSHPAPTMKTTTTAASGTMAGKSATVSAGLLVKPQQMLTARKRKISEREDDSSEEEGAISDSSDDVPLAKRCKTTHTASREPSRPAGNYGARTQLGAGKAQRAAPVLGRRVPSITHLATKGVGAARKVSDELRRRMKGIDEKLASHARAVQRRLSMKLPFTSGKARAPVSPEVPLRTTAVTGSLGAGYGMVGMVGMVGAGGVRGGLEEPKSHFSQRCQGVLV
ncbi:hypothetical protein FKP32DRAFT_1675468 [Trametes sanguinea]|nr:hypothetical protein FKP32DRAFT_1675468 [Trametes sanguinea]